MPEFPKKIFGVSAHNVDNPNNWIKGALLLIILAFAAIELFSGRK